MARPFLGSLVLPADTTAHRLSSLITAVEGTGGDAGASKRYAEISIRSDDANTGDIFIGGPTVSSTNFADRLFATGSKTIGAGNVMNNVATENIWIRSTVNSQKISFYGRIV